MITISDLQNKGFVNLEYPQNLKEAVNRTAESWKKFCALPDSIKKNLPYSNNTAGVGYELKNGDGIKGDKKENFDLTTAGADWLKQHAHTLGNTDALQFISQAVHLADIIKPTIIAFAEKLEKKYDLADFSKEVKESEGAYFVRFIHYFGDRNPEEETASAHVDQSGFTLHLFESDPGLQALLYNKTWMDMPVSEGETVIIPAMQLQLRSDGKLRALCHRVISNTKTALEGRYSAVCFIQLKNTPRYDKDAYGRLQEKEPGFNYEMTSEAFAKLFK